jgi:epoxyqueuosine reductase
VTALRERVVAAARAAGADAVRIAPVDAGATTRSRLRDAFARGDLATWAYDDAYARAASDARTVFAGAHSVVCIAMTYGAPPALDRRDRGRVSIYAQGEDYHVRLRAVLRAIVAAIEALGGRARYAVDTAPLAERAFAARAGLGWVGKHTNLIVPGLGSYVFLGEVVTSLALAPDPPLRTTCGTCARCIDVCPTGALRGDYTIDATRCISDLTQRLDPIPRALRPLIGTWVWGCDLCSEACPPTQRAPRPAAFGPRDDELRAPSLAALLTVRSGTYQRRFAPTAMGWRSAAILRRNAAVALGNTLDRAHVPLLAAALAGDPHPLVRAHVAWALGRLGSPQALAALREARGRESDALVSDEIAAALQSFSQRGVVDWAHR